MPPKAALRSGLKARSVEREKQREPIKKMKDVTQTINNGVMQVASTRVFSAIGVYSIAGRSDGKPKTNQDAYFIDTDIHDDPDLPLLGVFDGHGLCGHKVSQFLATNLKGGLGLF
jgi:hypothetical protein